MKTQRWHSGTGQNEQDGTAQRQSCLVHTEALELFVCGVNTTNQPAVCCDGAWDFSHISEA